MYFHGTLQIRTKIDRHDGYRSKPIWMEEEINSSTYDNVWMDSQCSVPISDINEMSAEIVAGYGR